MRSRAVECCASMGTLQIQQATSILQRMIIKSPSGYRLIIRGYGRPKFPPTSAIVWAPAFVTQGSIIGGNRRIFVNYHLKDTHLYQYKHALMPTAVSNQQFTLLTSSSPIPGNKFIKGEFYNQAIPPTVVDKYPLD